MKWFRPDGDCRKKYPRQYWFGAGTALAFIASAAIVAALIAQAYPPFYRPTLQLTSDTVAPGESLGFVQASSSPRQCQQEHARVMWRWEDATKTRRIVVPLTDGNPPPRIWDGPIVVSIPIPQDAKPGQ